MHLTRQTLIDLLKQKEAQPAFYVSFAFSLLALIYHGTVSLYNFFRVKIARVNIFLFWGKYSYFWVKIVPFGNNFHRPIGMTTKKKRYLQLAKHRHHTHTHTETHFYRHRCTNTEKLRLNEGVVCWFSCWGQHNVEWDCSLKSYIHVLRVKNTILPDCVLVFINLFERNFQQAHTNSISLFKKCIDILYGLERQ